MASTFRLSVALLAFLGLASPAVAHPPEDAEPEVKAKPWPFFGDKTTGVKAKTKTEGIVIIRKTEDGEDVEVMEWNADTLSESARELEDAIKNSDVVENLAAMLAGLADDIEVRDETGKGKALFFDGEEMLRFDLDRDVAKDERMSITGLGRNLTVERETLIVDGKTRTRIVIEMDGGDDVDIELPE